MVFLFFHVAYWKMDEFSWGKTRVVEGGEGQHGGGSGAFDPRSIVTKRIKDWNETGYYDEFVQKIRRQQSQQGGGIPIQPQPQQQPQQPQYGYEQQPQYGYEQQPPYGYEQQQQQPYMMYPTDDISQVSGGQSSSNYDYYQSTSPSHHAQQPQYYDLNQPQPPQQPQRPSGGARQQQKRRPK